MNKTKHTPGPWRHERMVLPIKAKDRRSGFVVNGPEDQELELPTRVCDMRVPSGLSGFREGEANARLIAAAPELFSSLEALLGKVHSLKNEFEIAEEIWTSDAGAAARAAIAKAEGGEE